jgi:hypothetical protein
MNNASRAKAVYLDAPSTGADQHRSKLELKTAIMNSLLTGEQVEYTEPQIPNRQTAKPKTGTKPPPGLAHPLLSKALKKADEVAHSENPDALIPEVYGLRTWLNAQPATEVFDYFGVAMAEFYDPDILVGETTPPLGEALPRSGETVEDFFDRTDGYFQMMGSDFYSEYLPKLYEALGYSRAGYPPEVSAPIEIATKNDKVSIPADSGIFTVPIVKSDGTVSPAAFGIKGDTYQIKDILKKDLGGKWNGKNKVWMYPNSRKEEVLNLLEERGFPVRDDGQFSQAPASTPTFRELSPTERAQWDGLLARLAAEGVDVELLQRRTEEGSFLSRENGFFSREGRVILMVMDNLQRPNTWNLRALLHETGHYVLGGENPALIRAVNRLAVDSLDGKFQSESTGVSAEETLVEALAARLQDEGFGAESQSIASRIFRLLKDFWMRSAIYIQEAVGFGYNEKLAMRYFENRMKMFVAGDTAFLTPFVRDIAAPPRTTAGVSRLLPKLEGEAEVPIIARDGGVIYPDALPVSRAAIEFNKLKPNSHISGLQFTFAPNGTEMNLSVEEARTWVDHAALVEEVEIIKEAARVAGVSPEEVVKALRKDNPSELMLAIQKDFPNAVRGEIGSMHSAMDQQAIKKVVKTLANYAKAAAFGIEQSDNKLEKAQEEANETAEFISQIKNDPANAALLDADLRRLMRITVKRMAKQNWERGELEAEHGVWVEVSDQLRRTVADMSDEYVEAFNKVLGNSGGLRPIDYMQALASLNVDWKTIGVKEALEMVNSYANQAGFNQLTDTQKQEVAPAFEAIKKNPALRAVLIAFAKGNSLRMNILQTRWEDALGKFGELGKTIDEVRTASDEALEQMRISIQDMTRGIDKRARLLRDLAQHQKKFNRTQREIGRTKERRDVLKKTSAFFQTTAEKWYERLGVTYDFDGEPGSEFPIMEPKKGGKVMKMGVMDFSNTPESFDAAFNKNKEWLDLNRDQETSPRYIQIQKVNDTLQRTVMFKDQANVKYNLFRRMMRSLPDSLDATGTRAGRAGANMIRSWESYRKMILGRVTRASQQWSKSYTDVVKAAGYKKSPSSFNRNIRSRVLFMLERELGIGSDNEAIRRATDLTEELLTNHIGPDPKAKVDYAKLRGSIGKWLMAEKKIGSLFDKLREEEGISIEDSTIRIMDPETGKVREARRLKGIEQGWLTSPRRLRTDIVGEVVRSIREVHKNYGKEGEDAVFFRDKDSRYWENQSIPFGDRFDALSAEMDQYMRNSSLVGTFFEPLVDMEDSQFKGVNAIQVREAWDAANGSFAEFVANLADMSNTNAEDAMLSAFGTFRTMAKRLKTMQGQGANQSVVDGLSHHAAGHFMMDSRHDGALPKEYFEYLTFDPISAMSFSATMAANKVFGRNGALLSHAFMSAETELDSRTARAKSDSEKAEIEDLKREIKGLQTKFTEFLTKSDNGPHVDEKFGMEMVSFLTGMTLNNPKTAITQVLAITDFVTSLKGINGISGAAMKEAVKEMTSMAGGSLLEAFGKHMESLPQAEREIAVMIGNLNRSGMSLAEHLADPGRGRQYESKGGVATKAFRTFRRALDAPLRVRQGTNERLPISVFNPFTNVATLANYSIAVAQYRMVKKVSEALEQYMQDYGINDTSRFDAMDPRVLKKLLKKPYRLGGRFFKINEQESLKQIMKQVESRFAMSFADFVKMQQDRKALGQRALNTSDVARIAQIAEDEVSLNSSINNRNIHMLSGPLRVLTPLWGWPVAKTELVHRAFNDEKNKASALLAGRMLLSIALFQLPVALAFSMMLDLYDEIFRGKSPNLKKVRLDNDAKENSLAMIERTARVGLYGYAGDIVSSVFNYNDAFVGGKPISLDDRVLVMSSIQGIVRSVGNFVQQGGNASYQTVYRPLIASMGASGMLQYTQLMNQALRTVGAEDVIEGVPLLKAEDKFTTRSNVYNIVRAAARVADVPIRAGGGFSSPTEATMHMREMQFAAFANDRDAFKEHYRKAVRAYMEQGEGKTYDEALSSVKQSWNRRHPINSITSRVLTDAEMRSVYSKMTDWQEDAVRNAARMHERYSMFLEGPTRSRSNRAPAYVPTPL